ncbi:hypothetical protein RBEAN4_1433 [Rickettsia bellii str. RML An4]|uniref:Uncharacterized protein n=1 Tax=Rickettsia bellii str. RML An4 TaxID=1359193 RepID=A0A0F3QCV7_RICBE|nr:hypothetical protein RBEAN4_1433 [Rickettsia bellii str. RML An4]
MLSSFYLVLEYQLLNVMLAQDSLGCFSIHAGKTLSGNDI